MCVHRKNFTIKQAIFDLQNKARYKFGFLIIYVCVRVPIHIVI